MGDVSNDGHFLTYVDWTTGDLAIRDLLTGEDRHLTDKGGWESPAFAEYSVLSPDASKVAYAWHREDGVYDLRWLERESSSSKVLVAGDGFRYLAPRDWSADGRHLLASRIRASGATELVLVSVPEGEVSLLGSVRGLHPGKIQLSPDGRFVAHDAVAEAGAPGADIHLLTVSDGTRRPLVAGAEDERILGWSPEGKWILFSRWREGRPSVWRVRVVDGSAVGPPQAVLQEVEQEIEESVALTASGDWYYGVMDWTNDLYLATVDATSASLVSPHRVAGRMEANSSADWSPDGRCLAWVASGGLDSRPRLLVVRDVESGTENRWPVAGKSLHGYRPRWSADGDSIVFDARDPWHGPVLVAIDVEDGSPRELARLTSPCADGCVEWKLDDGPRLETLWLSSGLTTGRAIERRQSSGHQAEQIYRAPADWSISRLARSPDRRWLAFVAFDSDDVSTRLALLPADGGPLRVLLELDGIEAHYSAGGTRIAWSRDSSFLLLGRSSGRRGRPVEFWLVPVEKSHNPVRLSHTLPQPSLYGMSLHPDGRTLALSLGERRRFEVWKLVGALP